MARKRLYSRCCPPFWPSFSFSCFSSSCRLSGTAPTIVIRKLYGSDLSRLAYVISNWRMAVPILIPWVMVSIVADIIFALPFEGPKQFLSSTEGEVIYFLGFLMIVAVFAPLVIQRFWGCYPLEPGFYRQRIEKLCRRAGIGYRNIVYWPIFGGRMLTAGVMGIARRFRYILVTDALLRSLAPEEVDAVIAHEIGHVKKHHLLYYIFFMAGFMLISFAIYDVTIFLIFYARPLYQMVLNLGIDQATIISSLFSVVFLMIFLVYFRFIFGYFMRTFERQADGYVYSLFDTARPMITTFQKIAATSGQSPDKPNWHHYSIRERIDYLLKCERNRHWIDRHNRKVRYSLLAFSIVMAGIAVMGYQLNYGRAGNHISTHFFEEILNQEIAKNAGQPGTLQPSGRFEIQPTCLPGNGRSLRALRWHWTRKIPRYSTTWPGSTPPVPMKPSVTRHAP